MNCKYCNEPLVEGKPFCPSCGKPVAEEPEVPEEITVVTEEIAAEEAAPETVVEETPAEETETKKTGAGKIAAAVVAVVLVLAVLISVIAGGLAGKSADSNEETAAPSEAVEATEGTIPPDGNPDDATCKGSYTVTDEEAVAAADTVVATMGDRELTVSQLQIGYWTEFYMFMQNYGSYASYFGLDYTLPLDTQSCMLTEEEMTWQQYFLACALESWQKYQSMALEAEEYGLEMDAEQKEALENLPADIEASAIEYGLTSGDEMIRQSYGAAATVADYADYWTLYYTGEAYYNDQAEKMQPTAEEVEAYFAENEATYAESEITKDSGKYVDVRHILLFPEGGTTNEETGEVTYTDEEWEACRAAAQQILDQWLAGEATEESFAALANEHSDDGGSNTAGGLYEGVYVGQMVPNFEAWCFDEARQVGDSGLVQTEYGYHIMYFVGSDDIWFVTAENDLLADRTGTLIPAAIEKYPAEIDYSAIVLGLVGMG